jgi:hypothetical protein
MQMRWLPYNIVKEKICYFASSKCGSRTMLGYGCMINSDNTGKIPTIEQLDEFSAKLLMDYQDGLKCPIRICIVRDPVDRLISAYISKFTGNVDPKAAKKMTFDQVLETMDDRAFISENRHFIKHTHPQVEFYGKDPSIFTHIFNMRQFEEIRKLLEEHSGRKLKNLHKNSTNSKFKPKLTPEQVEKIHKRYKEDLDIYGKWM